MFINSRFLQLWVLLCCSTSAIANTVLAPPEKLIQYHQGIESISREIKTAKEHRNAIITRMDEIGRMLGNVDVQSRDVVNREPTLLAGIKEIDQHIESLTKRIADTQEAQKFIEAQLSATPVPTLLEDVLGQSVDKHRARTIKKYQLHRTKSLLDTFGHEKQRLVASKDSLFASRQDIQGSLTELTRNRDALIEKRKHLETEFANLTSTIVQKQDRQTQLKKRLEDITRDPQKALFSSMQGNLPDPTNGEVKHHYAEPKAQGLLKWEGLVIGAPLGQEINAVFDGMVVFADHMQGLGNVAIIDHGEGYMSLYGMTDFLIVQPGQQVLGGDTIGTVGSGVGNGDSRLYFEVRQDAVTLNPTDWLKMSKISQDTGS